MPTRKAPRRGSLQFWPRKRAAKYLPRVNWAPVLNPASKIPRHSPHPGVALQGFIGYKAGMKSALVKDLTANSMTKDKKITLPVTIIECPPSKIFSIRFYKHGKVANEILAENLEKELKRKVKLPKNKKKFDDIKENELSGYDDLRVILYSIPKKAELKKTPDLSEIALSGNYHDKIKFVKEHVGKEFKISDIFKDGELIDVRGLTKGKGFQGAVRRFGITLKAHKSEKGVRRPGSLGPWHPTRVTFRAPMAGQLGMFTRVIYNNKILKVGNQENKEILEELKNLKNYGNVNSDYVILNGSIQGSAKRQLVLTSPLRISKMQSKKKYEFMELR